MKTNSISLFFVGILSFGALNAADAPASDASTMVQHPNYPASGPISASDLAKMKDALANPAPAKPKEFNVRDFGAKGDNATLDTDAFQKALDACNFAGGGIVTVPAGNYIIASVAMHGNTTLHLDKDVFVIEAPDVNAYPVIEGRFEGAVTQVHRGLIYADHADHIAITGPGGFAAAASLGSIRNPRAPVVVETVNCNDVTLDGFSIQYDRSVSRDIWCIHPLYCTNVVVNGLYIRSQGTNGDGIDIDSCSNMVVENCDINTGDDAISIKSGRGMEAVRIGKPTENLVIKDSILRSSIYAAIGFGTEISGGVRNVTVSNCTISGVQNAVFIKSRDGRGGYMENIAFNNVTVDQSPDFVGIDLISKGIQASEPVPGDVEQWTLVRGLSFTNIKVNNLRSLIVTQPSQPGRGLVGGPGIAPQRPIEGLTLANISGTTQRGITLTNVLNANFSNITVTGYMGDLFNLTNVTGTGLENPTKAADAPAAQAASTPAP